jgi:hypothetical protein
MLSGRLVFLVYVEYSPPPPCAHVLFIATARPGTEVGRVSSGGVVGTPRWRGTRSAHGAIHTRPRFQIAPSHLTGPPRHGSESHWQPTTLS